MKEDIFLNISTKASLRIMAMLLLLLLLMLLLSVKNEAYDSQNEIDEADCHHYSLTEICRIKAEETLQGQVRKTK